ncbi:MAG: hypothetical protein D6790_04235, partial [Caldilineae bacterium]
MLENVATCGVQGNGLALPGQGAAWRSRSVAALASGPVWFAEIAFDTDVEFYRANSSSTQATVDDIEAVLNGVDAIFMRDVRIGYQLTSIIVRTTEPDPYNSTDAHTLLDQVRAEWWDTLRNDRWDIAHLMTGKNLNGTTIGVAWTATVCRDRSHALGLSESRFSATFNRRIWLTAHELGHNWGACHCDDTNCVATPPSDCD